MPTLRQMTSAVVSAIPRSVVPLPPVMVTNPSTPSVSRVIEALEGPAQLAARVGVARPDERAGGRPGGAALGRARPPGSASSPRRTIRSTWSSGTPRSSGSSTTHELVPTTDRPRWGTMMSPSPEAWSRLMTMLHQRPRTASITPGEGRIGTSSRPSRAICSAHGPVAFTTRSPRISLLGAVREIADADPGHEAVGDQQLGDDDPVGGWSRRSPSRVAKKRQRHPHGVHRRVGDLDGHLEVGVEVRLQAERLLAGHPAGRDARSPGRPRRRPARRPTSSSVIATKSPSFSSNEPGRSARGSGSPRCTRRPTPCPSRRSARRCGAGRGGGRWSPR